jgi:hypothetical protein
VAYITGDQIRAEHQTGMVSTGAFDASYDELADVVSAAIDEHCFRSFAVPTSATARTFHPTRDLCMVDELDDIADTTSLAVAVDLTDSGTYSALSSTAWFAEVDNRSGRVLGIRSTSTFPWSVQGRRTLQVTARYGWPAVPGPVERAALIWALRLLNRRQTPTGIMGFGEFGGVRLSTIDPDVRALLSPFRRRARLLR